MKTVIPEQCLKELQMLKNLLSHKNPNLSYGELISILSKEAIKKQDPRERVIRQKPAKPMEGISSAPKLERATSSKETLKKRDIKERGACQKPAKPVERIPSAPKLEKAVSPKQDLKKQSPGERATGQKPAKPRVEVPSAMRPQQKFKKISRAIPSYLRQYIWKRNGGRCTYIHRETNRRCASRHLLQIDHIQPFALGGKTEKENLRLLCAGHNRDRWTMSPVKKGLSC